MFASCQQGAGVYRARPRRLLDLLLCAFVFFACRVVLLSPADSGELHLHGEAHPPIAIDCLPLMFRPSTGDLELSIRFRGLVEG
jgi:hypothetical protein